MATTEQTANGVVGPEAAGSETVAQDPTLEGSAPLSAPDTSMEAPTATEGAQGKGLAMRLRCSWYRS